MSITPYLEGSNFDPETERIMGIAFEMTCVALKVTHSSDMLRPIIAKKIIELAKAGERDPNGICELALLDLRAFSAGGDGGRRKPNLAKRQ